jgi:cyclin-dependent kinase 8/11
VLKTYKIQGFISSGKSSSGPSSLAVLTYWLTTTGTYGRVYKALLLAPPAKTKAPAIPTSTRAALSLSKDKLSLTAGEDPLTNPELCMRPGDLPAKEGDVFAIKKFKPDKEGDIQTYAGISQSGAREILVSAWQTPSAQ